MVFGKSRTIQGIVCMFLDNNLFKTIIKSTPLISIDFVIENNNKQILLGKRINRPAKGFWFVPGGRVLKDEKIKDAFTRLVKVELGIHFTYKNASFLGVYEHFYKDNFSDDDFTTHYIVLGYKIILDEDSLNLPSGQHSAYQWFDITELCKSELVHDNTKAYFE
jgi:colanic acid biosynthesis protein WcaH